MVFEDGFVLILHKAGTSSLKGTCDAIKGQRDSEGWATAVGVMNQEGMIVLGG